MAGQRYEIPTLVDDGLLTPEVGPWAEEKYRLVNLYATLFTTSMRGKWEQLAYVDLFAGSGRSRIRETERIVPASPTLALSLEVPFDRYVFCEADSELMDALIQRVRRDFGHLDVRFVPGNVNSNVPSILTELPKPSPGNKVLAFCFVDPFGLSNLRFATIEQLAARYMDFLVLVPSGYDATRNQGIYLEPANRTIDRFLGSPDWRERWEKDRIEGQTFDAFITNEFGESMRRLRYLYEGVEATQIVRLGGTKRARLYRLALFSRKSLGAKFWREVRKYATDQRSFPF